MEQGTTLTPGGEPSPVDTTGLCLLSLDGGGVRGLSSLYVLKSIMDQLNYVRRQDKLPPVKPCEVFDLIGGTSTGGLIAIMLGRLEMDVDACIGAYSDLASAVFGEKLSSIPFNFKGDIKARFDSAKLQSAIEKVVDDSGASKQDLFHDGTERGCRTFVCTADRHTKDVVRLRSYSLPHEPNIRATICQAALATSAATTFFEPVSIGDRSFADGGLGANNPVDEVEGEASNIWCLETGDLKPLVKCFISIGTGNPGKKPFEDSMLMFLGQTVVQIATETENAERRFIARWARHFDEKRYFRFNVEQGLQGIGLDEYKKKGVMEAATEGYLTHMAQKFRVRDCIQNMRLKKNKAEISLATIIHRDGRSILVSPGRGNWVNQEVRRPYLNGNIFYGHIHYYGHVGSFKEVINRGAKAIERSNKSLQHSQEQREAQSSYTDSLMGAVIAAGELLFRLLLGGPIIISSVNTLAGNYFEKLTITQDALVTHIRETDTISEDLHASNVEVEDAMTKVDLKVDELYALLFGQDYATKNLSIDAVPEVSQYPWKQDMEDSDAGKVEVHYTDHVNTCFYSERPSSEEARALADQRKKFELSSGPASSPDATLTQQIEIIQLFKQQLAMLAEQKCQLSEQLSLIRLEIKAQQTALEISQARIRDLQAREQENERQRRRAWCSIL